VGKISTIRRFFLKALLIFSIALITEIQIRGLGKLKVIMANTKVLDRFLKTGIAEGLSFVVLVAIAMPLKYIAGIGLPVRIVGMLHGILFILYTLLLIHAAFVYKWTLLKTIGAFLLSFIPTGTFFLKSLLKNEIRVIKSVQPE
jgi:integral membrane protein